MPDSRHLTGTAWNHTFGVPRDVRRPLPGRVRGVVALGLVTLAGCSAGPVTIDAPEMSSAESAACRDLVTNVPEVLAGQDRRQLSGDTNLGAAWGDPAIVLTCGVPEPADFTETSTCIEANGVGWYVPDSVLLSDDESLDVTMTAVGFRPRVQVLLPGDYRPEGFLDVAAIVGGVVAAELGPGEPCR